MTSFLLYTNCQYIYTNLVPWLHFLLVLMGYTANTLMGLHITAGVVQLASLVTIGSLTSMCSGVDLTFNLYRLSHYWDDVRMVLVPHLVYTAGVNHTTQKTEVQSAPVAWGEFSPFGIVMSILVVSMCISFASGITIAMRTEKVQESIYITSSDHLVSRLRWLEYSISAPLMIWLVSYYSGISDPATLVVLFVITALTMWLGQAMTYIVDMGPRWKGEYVRVATNAAIVTQNENMKGGGTGSPANLVTSVGTSTSIEAIYDHAMTDASASVVQRAQKKITAVLLVTAWALHILVWSIITWSFVDATSHTAPPSFVTAIYVFELGLFTLFGIVQTIACLQDNSAAAKQPPTTIPWVEYAYPILSITSKTFLTWMIYAYVLSASC
jgi:hypothetical protein